MSMKKLFYLLLLALPVLGFSSCSDDDDVPDVTMSATISGATRVDNALYAVAGDVIDIQSVNITDNNNKGAAIGSAEYFWDNMYIGSSIVAPFGKEIDTTGVPAGTHQLKIKVSVYVVDYAPCIGYLVYPVNIVESADDIPTEGDIEQSPSLPLTVSLDDAV